MPNKVPASHPVMGGSPIKTDKLSGVKFISGQMKGSFNPYIITSHLPQGHCLQLLVYTAPGKTQTSSSGI